MKHDYAKQEWLNQPIIIDLDKWQKRLDYVCGAVVTIGFLFLLAHIGLTFLGIRP